MLLEHLHVPNLESCKKAIELNVVTADLNCIQNSEPMKWAIYSQLYFKQKTILYFKSDNAWSSTIV
jgi:hypothetical protein